MRRASAKNKKSRYFRKAPHIGPTWRLQDAKARLSQVVREAQKMPQIITLDGEEVAVIQSIKHYRGERDARAAGRPNLLLELLKCPPGPPLLIERDPNNSILDAAPNIFD